MTAQLFSCLDKLVDSVSTNSDCTSTFRGKKKCSIEKIMREVHSINRDHFRSELHTFATKLLCLRSRRKM
jgi:hypothetical protein